MEATDQLLKRAGHPSKSTSKKGKSPDPFGEWREHKSPSYHKSANQSKLSRSTLVSFPSHCQPALPSYGQGANHPGLPQPPLQTKANTCGLSNLSSENVSCNVTLLWSLERGWKGQCLMSSVLRFHRCSWPPACWRAKFWIMHRGRQCQWSDTMRQLSLLFFTSFHKPTPKTHLAGKHSLFPSCLRPTDPKVLQTYHGNPYGFQLWDH